MDRPQPRGVRRSRGRARASAARVLSIPPRVARPLVNRGQQPRRLAADARSLFVPVRHRVEEVDAGKHA